MLNLFRRKGPKRSPTSFSPVTSRNVRLSTQNFLTFSFKPFATFMFNFKAIPNLNPKLFNLNQEHPSKTFGQNIRSEVMITSLTES